MKAKGMTKFDLVVALAKRSGLAVSILEALSVAELRELYAHVTLRF